jgi:hypothetical protein
MTHGLARGFRHLLAVDQHASAIWPFQCEQQPQQRGFARSAGADDGIDGAGIELQVDIVERGDALIAPGDVFEREQTGLPRT